MSIIISLTSCYTAMAKKLSDSCISMHNSCMPIYDDLLNRYLYSDIDDVDVNSHLYVNSDFSTNSIISKPL